MMNTINDNHQEKMKTLKNEMATLIAINQKMLDKMK